MNPCFGIDLGTTTAAIGWIRDGQPELIPVDGEVLMPSVVAWPSEGGVLVGRPALNHYTLEPLRTVRSAKRRMGTDHVFTVGELQVTPAEVAALVLGRLLDAAEAETGARPTRAVITVPAWFTQAQRADTRRAGEAAGLNVERIINEPTAAALAHAHGQDVQRTVLVYDFGGGTFDVSLVRQDGPVVEVQASQGDSQLGGDDVDTRLTGWILDRIGELEPRVLGLIEDDDTSLARIRAAAEKAKIALATSARAVLRMPFMVELDGEPWHLELTVPREELEELALPLMKRTFDLVAEVLRAADTKPADVDDLLFVGGSTGLPQLWTLLRRRFGLEGNARIPPQLAVALGATIQAAIVDGSRVHGVLVDVAPFALSIGVASGGIPGYPTHFTCSVITPRNSQLPSRHTHLLRTADPLQTRIRIPVYQGSDPDPRNNTILGEIVLEDIPPALEGELSRPVAIGFRHDLDGMVEIVITDQLTERTVRGQLAADGADQTRLRETWEAHATRFDLKFGEGGPVGEPPSAGPDPALAGKLAEARGTFEAVIGGLETLEVDDAEARARIEDLARKGQLAAGMGEVDRAVALHDELQDLMFEHGVYL